MNIQYQTVLITGGNRGIGYAFAKVCAKENANLIIASRQFESSLQQELLNLGAKTVEHISCDLSSRDGVDQFCEKISNRQIDILFNNAGLLTGGLIEKQNTDDIYKMLQVNVNALIQTTQAVIPHMIQNKKGKIINHASVSAVMHFPCASTYAAAKAAVWAFTDCLRLELESTGVSTLCLFTPGIKTRMFDQIDDLYSHHIDIAQSSIHPDLYAEQIIRAIKKDQANLKPTGATGLVFWLAQYFPLLFRQIVKSQFKR